MYIEILSLSIYTYSVIIARFTVQFTDFKISLYKCGILNAKRFYVSWLIGLCFWEHSMDTECLNHVPCRRLGICRQLLQFRQFFFFSLNVTKYPQIWQYSFISRQACVLVMVILKDYISLAYFGNAANIWSVIRKFGVMLLILWFHLLPTVQQLNKVSNFISTEMYSHEVIRKWPVIEFSRRYNLAQRYPCSPKR